MKKAFKVIKEIAHWLVLFLIVAMCGYLAYHNEWEIIRNYKEVVVLAFILILMVEIVFYGGKKND